MRYAAKLSLVVATVAAVGAAGTIVAWANWPIPGSAQVKSRTAAVPRGVTPSVAKSGKKAVVSWSAQQIAPEVPMLSYLVTAHSVDSPGRPDIVKTVMASGGSAESVTFAAAEVAGGKWYWTLVPRFHSWVGEESKRSDRLNFPAAAGADVAPEAAAPLSADQAVVAPEEETPVVQSPSPAAPKPSPPQVVDPPAVTPPDPPEETAPEPPAAPPSADSSESATGTE